MRRSSLSAQVERIVPAFDLEDADDFDPGGPSSVHGCRSGESDVGVALWGLITRTESLQTGHNFQFASRGAHCPGSDRGYQKKSPALSGRGGSA
jgi:hypothetical protein